MLVCYRQQGEHPRVDRVPDQQPEGCADCDGHGRQEPLRRLDQDELYQVSWAIMNSTR